MTVLLAVLAVGAGSLLFRVGPLLGANRLPDRLPVVAGWAGLSVLAAITVRSVLHHEDAGVPAAPLLAALAVGSCLVLAFRGRSLLVATGVGGAAYVALAALTRLPLS
jgi:branched-subunit amino acid transport protein